MLGLTVFGGGSRGLSAEEPPRARVSWTDVAPTVDGSLDEPLWQRGEQAGGLRERTPEVAARPPVDTRFTVLIDAAGIYFGLWCSDDGEVTARSSARDSGVIFRDDAISLKIDPKNDRRTTLGFVVNPAGARLDYLGANESEFLTEYDAIWRGAARRTEAGWTVEIAIPWSSLGIDPADPPDAMGFNISRDHARRSATYDWALMPPPFSPISASLYGRLEGLSQLRKKIGSTAGAQDVKDWSLVPYYRLGLTHARPGDARFEGDVGADARVDFGPFAATLSLNTDFAQVELDDRVVNLTRFGLFLPEKRDFFLSDLDLYRFGNNQRHQILHTRRIGLSDGRAVPILTGLKLHATPSDEVQLGLLQVTTRALDDALAATSHLVARGQLALDGGSHAGVMVTDRRSLDDAADYNLVVGVDGAFRGDRDAPWLVEGFAALAMTGAEAAAPQAAAGGEGVSDGAGQLGFKAQWRGALLRPRVEYFYTDARFRADLGFVRRVGVHEGLAELQVTPRFSGSPVESLRITAAVDGVADESLDELLDWQARLAAALNWNAGFEVSLSGRLRSDTVTEAFTLGSDTEIGAGVYEGWEVTMGGGLPSTWLLSASVDVLARDFFGGLLIGGQGSLSLRPSPLFRFDIAGQFNRIRFDDTRPDFDVSLINSRITLGFTPDLTLDVFGGYDHLGDALTVQGRLRYSYRRGSDVFLVYQVDVDTGAGDVDFHSLLAKATFRIP